MTLKTPKEYPEGLTEKVILKMLLASCQKLEFKMGGVDATKDCVDLINKWDTSIPTIHYLKRNMKWAQIVLDRKES